MQSGSKGYGLYLKNFCVELWESNKKRSLQYLRTSCSAREIFVTAHEKPSSRRTESFRCYSIGKPEYNTESGSDVSATPPMHSMKKPSVSFIFTYIYDKIFH